MLSFSVLGSRSRVRCYSMLIRSVLRGPGPRAYSSRRPCGSPTTSPCPVGSRAIRWRQGLIEPHLGPEIWLFVVLCVPFGDAPRNDYGLVSMAFARDQLAKERSTLAGASPRWALHILTDHSSVRSQKNGKILETRATRRHEHPDESMNAASLAGSWTSRLLARVLVDDVADRLDDDLVEGASQLDG